MEVDTNTTTTPLDNITNDVYTTVSSSLDTNTTTTNNTINTGSSSSSSCTTTLPPRKRAKTQEEKEQRKIERILRNRRAAHASREKKRRHVEYLEVYVVKLEENLQKLSTGYQHLLDKLSPQDQTSIEELGLQDVSELKNQIHSNLSGSRRGGSSNNNSRKGDHEDDDEEVEGDDDEENELEESRSQHESLPDVDIKVEPQLQPQSQSPPSKKRKYSKKEKPTTTSTPPSSTRSSSLTSSPVHIKIEEGEEHQQQKEFKNNNENSLQPQAMNDKTFYNYLSPISIHSSASSPMDFTLTSKSDFNDFAFGEVKPEEEEDTKSLENTSPNTNPQITSSHEDYTQPQSQQQPQPSSASTTEVSTQDSNLSLYESGQNSAVILSIEEEKQLPQSTLVDILEKENRIHSAVAV
ncbi:HAC1 [Candida margitis]|uniref:HAC1 n=1 Tax=Candida margitis TaxID=1775924 RepID=UPI0022264F7E|nr:HAC1 [Candida margitis]KAI5955418.1 HAC1 [Candida margitis]